MTEVKGSSAQGTGKKPRSGFRKAMVVTAIPFLVVSVAWVIGAKFLANTPFTALVGFPVLAVPAAIIVAVILAVTRRRQLAAGVLAGLGIGIVAMGASCFASAAITG